MKKVNGVIDRIGVNGAKVVFTLLGYDFAYSVDENSDQLCLTEKGDTVSFECDDYLTVSTKTFENDSLKSIGNL